LSIAFFFGLVLLLNTNAYTLCKHKKQDKIVFSNQANVIDDLLVGTITVINNEVKENCLVKVYDTRDKSTVNVNFRVDYEMVVTVEMN
jgi:hypothetical protein